ncbi:MAG: Ig-like domain-containing protein [Ignavibacteriales bacterium]|nr:Ig-like domain-containing protein [Ignavibacteriales bacterium]
MNLRSYLFLCGLTFLLLNAGCQQNPVESTTATKASSISGLVLDAGSKPLALARVIDLGTLAKEDTTKSDGSYKLQLQLASNYNTSVFAILSGYVSDTQKVSLSPGEDKTPINIHMTVQDSSKIVSGISGPAASIILVKQTANTIALWGTGPNVTSTLTFKVVDSTGTPVVGINRSMVKFVLSGGPGAGEFIRPAAALTDAVGEVSTTVTSGTKPGVLQVIATTRGDSVKTSPVFLVTGRGLPDSAGVSIAATKLNIAGRVFSNLTTSISLFVGDRFGNPVADGTSITFVSNGGIIMPSATTKDGVATVDLKSGGADAPPGGLVTVSASTTGDKSYRLSDSLITRKMQILFSGPTQPPTLDTNAINLTIPNGGIKYFSFTVADDYGNPLVEGSTVTVTVKATDTLQTDLELFNNTKTFKDGQSRGATRISVGVHDKGSVKLAGILTFGIEIKSPNGDYSNSSWFQGYVAGEGAPTGTFNVPTKIELVDSISTLYLAETNISAEISKTLTFVVKDALNNPINAASKTLVTFSFLNQPGGTTLSKTQDSTNSSGRVAVKINSGNTWGTATVVAMTIGETGLISATSLPIKVARGLPDSTRIFLDIDKKNMFNKIGAALGTLSINLIDKDGFPAAPQDDLRASTTGGYVNPPSTTENGKSSLTLNGGLPEPNDPSPGLGNILLYVPVHGGVTVTKSQPFMFSYAPQIAYTKTTIIDSAANTLRASIADGGSVDVDYAVWDKNRNPISGGNSIKVTVTGPAVQELELSGDIDLTTTDTQAPLDAIHRFSIKNKSGGGKGSFVVTITVTGASGTSTRILNGYALPPVAAEKIALASEPLRILNVRGSGSNETSTLTYQVTNLTNNPIDANNAVYVDLSVLDVLGGVTISPTRILTDGSGKAVVTLTSGNRYGTVRVVASFNDGSTTISSPQEVFNVTGPAANNFALQISKNNLPGVGTSNPAVGIVTATVADSVGGSLPVGTRVNFRTLNGGAVTSTALTDANGVATANIKGGNIPNDPVRGMGFGTIQAWMMGNNGDTLKKSIPFLLSGPPATIYFTDAAGLPITPLSTPIADGGSEYVYFKIRDINWRPVSNDYAISVAVEGDSGSIDVKNISTIRDIANMSDTAQICSFQLIDKIKGGGTSGPIKVTITVSNKDIASTSITIPGTLAPAAGAISTRAAEINFVTSSTAPVYVQNTGLPSATTLTFALIDSNNHPVTLLKADNVLFSILNGTGQEWLSSTDTLSDANGQVTTTFHTGTKSGTFIVMAQLKNTPTIKASTNVTIVGGFPDPNKFTLQWAVTPPDTLLNLAGLVLNSVLVNVNILTLDKYSNPAKPSVIQFDETSGGSVGAVTTDASGRASASLSGGKPYPNEPSIGSEYGLVGPNRGFGFGFVKARTITENGTFLRDSLPFLFTGSPVITTNVDSVIVNDGGSADITVRIADVNGKMLSAFPKITITWKTEGVAAGSFSTETDLPSSFTPTDNAVFPTTYHLKITDNTPNGGISGHFTIKIDVDGPNGYKAKTIFGTLLPGVSGYASSIQLLAGSPSASTISVKGTGVTETSTMSFVVKDSLGNPVNPTHSATVSFSIVGGPGGGEFVSPLSAVTDANGKVTTTVNAGTKAGVMQVVATTTINSTTITSAPVPLTIASGLADPAHFTLWTDKLNWTGIGVQIGTVFVQMGDKYGNPVQPNTALYFTINGGIIASSGFTDALGHASASVFGGNPNPGIDTITVSTLGQGGVTITQKVTTVYSGVPIVRVDNTNLGTISVGSSLLVNYAVADANRNPLASGNTIGVTVSGTAGALAQLSGDISVTTTDTKDTNTTKYQFTIANNVPQGGSGGSFTVTITVNGPNGTTTKILTGTLASPLGTITAPTQIVLSTVSSSIIAASGTGGLNTSNLTFQALDAGGRAIGLAQSDTVFFSLSDTAGGAHLIPTWAMSDANGQASTKFYAGTKYGVPTVSARLKTISSQPVPVRISGPSWTNFNVTISANNLPGLSQIGTIVGKLNAQIGDTLGNPVLAGTIIKFTTSGGMVDASATTDVNGSANINISGGATPNEPSLGGIGWGYVTAQTQGNSGTTLQKRIPFLFSGAPIITTVNVPSNDTLILLDAGYTDIDYKIADGNGNPLAAGNAVQVTVSGADASEIGLSNYVDFSTNGTTDINQTTYRVRIADNLPSSGTGGYFDISIKVSGPNGISIRQFHGYLRAPGAITPPSPSAKMPAQIAFVSVSSTDIYVSGTGSTETSAITYEVRDSLGTLIDTHPRAFAQFTIQFFPNTYTNTGTQPRLIPNADSTDDNARLHVSIASGTQAGIIQVYAKIDLGGGKIVTSQPVKISVHAGFADQRHFTLAPKSFNFGGLETAFWPDQMTVQVVDKYSNPVLPGTAVYFNTMHGAIGTGKSGLNSIGTTDIDGFVNQTLWSSNPFPEFADTINLGPGFSWVYARTLGESATWVVDSALVIWTGQPIISNLTGPATYTIGNGGSAGPWTFTIADKYGHPMSSGTKITVAGAGLSIDGDANLTMPDIGPSQTTFIVPTGAGITSFTIVVSDADAGTVAVPPIKSLLTITIVHPVYGTFTRVIASGTVQ